MRLVSVSVGLRLKARTKVWLGSQIWGFGLTMGRSLKRVTPPLVVISFELRNGFSGRESETG
eukprot:1189845-Amorphochlora_amoeboformis.AAC.1